MSPLPSRPLDDEDLKVLAASAPLVGLSPGALAEVARAARKVALKRGQVLFRQGDRAEAVYLLLAGRVKVMETSDEGRLVVLRLEGPGAPLGLLSALGSERFPVTAEASEPCAAARWPGGELSRLMQRHPLIALNALPMVLERLRAVQDQYRELATERVERRVARAVLRLVRQAGRRTEEGVQVDAALTRQELAEMSGTTLYTVSRLLSGWAHDGVLVTRGKKLLIRQPHVLVKIAEDFDGLHGP